MRAANDAFVMVHGDVRQRDHTHLFYHVSARTKSRDQQLLAGRRL